MKTFLPVPYTAPPKRLRRAGRLPGPVSPVLVVRREPGQLVAWWSVDGRGRSGCLTLGVICFVTGALLPLLLAGFIGLGLGLNYVGGRQAAGGHAPPAPRPRLLVVLPTLTPTPQPVVQPAADPAPQPSPHSFLIQVIERDLVPTPIVEAAPTAILKPVHPLTGWPVAGPVSQRFGCSAYYTGLPGPDCPAEAPWFHDGVDIAAGAGTLVRAALTGTVLFAGADGDGPVCREGYRGYGQVVVIAGETGWQALYAHLAQVNVMVGQAVTPETIIGAVGETGCVSGVHLHFGLRHNGALLDPEAILGPQGQE